MNRHFRTVILALGCAILVAASLFAQAAGQPKAVAAEPIKDVGVVAKGEKATHDFVLRNEGSVPLQITDVKASCGCTVADYDKTIAPGQTGKVRVAIDTATFNGPIAKGVTVFTNDPAAPQMELTIRAKVEPFISVKPGYARYIVVQGETQEGKISQTLWAPDGASFDVVKVESPYPHLKTSFREARPEERIADAPGKQWKVEMQLSNSSPVGPLSDSVQVHTNHPKQKLVQIPVSGFVRPTISVTPSVADFGQIELKEPLRKAINIKAFSTENVKVTGVQENIAGLDTQLEALEEGREYQVRVILKPEMVKGPFNGKLTILTDSPRMPKIEVELKGTVI